MEENIRTDKSEECPVSEIQKTIKSLLFKLGCKVGKPLAHTFTLPTQLHT